MLSHNNHECRRALKHFGIRAFKPRRRRHGRCPTHVTHNKLIMKKLFLLLLVMTASALAGAQTRFGYVNYDSVMTAMPEYALAQKSLADLRVKYANEMKRSEDEFNAKYEEFLDGQRDYVPSILHKRQAELQDMMDKNTAFRKEAQRLLKQAENDAYAPVRTRLDAAIRKVAQEQTLAFVLNTSAHACPYVDASQGINVTPMVAALVIPQPEGAAAAPAPAAK